LELQKADYIQLRRIIEEKGLLRYTELYYLVHFLVTITLFVLLFSVVLYFNKWYVLLLLIVPLSFVATHFGYLGHDAGHWAISNKEWVNEMMGQLSYSFLLGGSFSYWKYKHNLHHSHPNTEGSDPDIDLTPFSLTEARAMQKRGIKRWATRFQAWLFPSVFPILLFLIRYDGYRYLIKKKRLVIDWILLLSHVLLFFVIIPYLIGLGMAILVYMLLSMLIGVYIGFTFTPNHVGMPILDNMEDMPFLEKQVMTSRNIKSGVLLNYIFGGLDCQIEHHLFPKASRKNLLKIRNIVKEYCAEHSIPYKNESVAHAWKDIFTHLNTMGKYAKKFHMLKMAKDML